MTKQWQPCRKYWGLGHDIECVEGILIDIDEYMAGREMWSVSLVRATRPFAKFLGHDNRSI